MTCTFLPHRLARTSNQRGASLIMVMIVLTIVSMLGVAGIQISMMSERGARNDRDLQIAWQSAEAALIDAEFDIYGPGASTRRSTFTVGDISVFASGCGLNGTAVSGLCTLATTGKPAWLTVDFTATGAAARTTQFGDFTGRTFAAGGAGIQPAKPPRYVIEPLRDYVGGGNSRDLSATNPNFVYRVTSMGFGPRPEIQALVQMVYRD